LKEGHNMEPKRGEDGMLSKDFMVSMHTILYKYKKYAADMIAEANFDERVSYLRQAEEHG